MTTYDLRDEIREDFKPFKFVTESKHELIEGLLTPYLEHKYQGYHRVDIDCMSVKILQDKIEFEEIKLYKKGCPIKNVYHDIYKETSGFGGIWLVYMYNEKNELVEIPYGTIFLVSWSHPTIIDMKTERIFKVHGRGLDEYKPPDVKPAKRQREEDENSI